METYTKKDIKELIFVVNGKPRSGKDTFANNIISVLKTLNSDDTGIYFENLSTIDQIKCIAKKCFGWDGIKDEKGRRLLADLKDASRRYNEGPFNYILENRQIFKLDDINLKNKYLFVTVVHSREPSEIKMFKDYFGDICYTVLVRRDLKENSEENLSNHADKNVENYDYDIVIDNNGTLEEYEKKCIDVIREKLIEIGFV